MYSLSKVVRVIRPGVFNGPDHKRLPRADAGDVIEVAAGGYAESLIADGWVTDELSEHIPEPELAERSPANIDGTGEGEEGLADQAEQAEQVNALPEGSPANSVTEDHAPTAAKKPRRSKKAKDGE